MTIDIRLLGRVDYASTVQAMQDYTATRTPTDADTLWICEHPPLYTQGIAGKSDHVLDPGEIPVIDPETGEERSETNAVTIRKLPEAQLSGRDQKIFGRLPIWFSFESTAGLLFRSAPVFSSGALVYKFQTKQLASRVHLAPHLTTAIHLGPVHIVPSIGIIETFYGEAQARIDGINRVLGTNIVRSARDFSVDLVLPSLARVFEKEPAFVTVNRFDAAVATESGHRQTGKHVFVQRPLEPPPPAAHPVRDDRPRIVHAGEPIHPRPAALLQRDNRMRIPAARL